MDSHFSEILLVFLLVVLVGGFYIIFGWWYERRRWRLGWEKSRAKVEQSRRNEGAGVPPSPTDYHYAITFDSQDFAVKDLRDQNREVARKSWASVQSVTVFKRDLFGVDCICLSVADADGMVVELNEEMAGWKQLVDGLPTQLPGCKAHSEWFSVVAFPAFEANPTRIYLRNGNKLENFW